MSSLEEPPCLLSPSLSFYLCLSLAFFLPTRIRRIFMLTLLLHLKETEREREKKGEVEGGGVSLHTVLEQGVDPLVTFSNFVT